MRRSSDRGLDVATPARSRDGVAQLNPKAWRQPLVERDERAAHVVPAGHHSPATMREPPPAASAESVTPRRQSPPSSLPAAPQPRSSACRRALRYGRAPTHLSERAGAPEWRPIAFLEGRHLVDWMFYKKKAAHRIGLLCVSCSRRFPRSNAVATSTVEAQDPSDSMTMCWGAPGRLRLRAPKTQSRHLGLPAAPRPASGAEPASSGSYERPPRAQHETVACCCCSR